MELAHAPSNRVDVTVSSCTPKMLKLVGQLATVNYPGYVGEWWNLGRFDEKVGRIHDGLRRINVNAC